MGSSTSSASRSRSPPATGPAAPLLDEPDATADTQQQLAANLDAWKILVHAKQHYGQRLALVDCHSPAAFYAGQDGANLTTYGVLYDHVLGLAGHLASLGIGRGSRVAVMLRNCAEVGAMQQSTGSWSA
jgi:long-subunit acyl-CoA synthetase (AMP-forming)